MGIFQRGKFLVDGLRVKFHLHATSIFHDCVLFYAVTTDVKNLLECSGGNCHKKKSDMSLSLNFSFILIIIFGFFKEVVDRPIYS